MTRELAIAIGPMLTGIALTLAAKTTRYRDWRRTMLWVLGTLCIVWTVIVATHLVH
jgi:hypothetical protein